MESTLESEKLESLDHELWTHVSSGLSASAAIILLNQQVCGQKEKGEIFKNSVANTFAYKALESLEKKAVVRSFEIIDRYLKENRGSHTHIRGYMFLRHHRDHAARLDSTEWEDPNMMQFFTNELSYQRAVRLYQARESVLRRIEALKKAPHQRPENRAIPTEGVAKMIRSAMEGIVRRGTLLSPNFDAMIEEGFRSVTESVALKAQKTRSTF